MPRPPKRVPLDARSGEERRQAFRLAAIVHEVSTRWKNCSSLLNRSPYKCKKTWDSDMSENEIQQAQEAIDKYGGYLDKGAVTKWYKLDKDFVSSEMYRYSSYVRYKLNLTDEGELTLSDSGKKEATSMAANRLIVLIFAVRVRS